MRRYLMALGLLAVAFLPLGCGDGMAYTAQENRDLSRRIHDTDRRQLVDDLRYLMLEEKQTRLSRWAIAD